MREIKFRAWETKEKRMLHNGQFDIHLSSISGYGISHHFHDEIERQYKFVTCKRNNWDENNPEVILMQYTGLKDKNGKEIYEGDILEARTKYTFKKDKDRPDRVEELVVVYFGEYNNGQGYEEQENGIGFYTKVIGWEDFTIMPLDNFINQNSYEQYGMENTVKIIGNIYENPELLEEKINVRMEKEI